jgi:hypothetical protein
MAVDPTESATERETVAKIRIMTWNSITSTYARYVSFFIVSSFSLLPKSQVKLSGPLITDGARNNHYATDTSTPS